MCIRHRLGNDWHERTSKTSETTCQERGMDGTDWTKGTWFINDIRWVLSSIRDALCYFCRTKMPSSYGCVAQVQWDLPAESVCGNRFSHWSLWAVSRTCVDHLPLLPRAALNYELLQQCREGSGPPAAWSTVFLQNQPVAVLWRVGWMCMEQAMVRNLRGHAFASGHPLLWQHHPWLCPKAPWRRRQMFLAVFIYCVLE